MFSIKIFLLCNVIVKSYFHINPFLHRTLVTPIPSVMQDKKA